MAGPDPGAAAAARADPDRARAVAGTALLALAASAVLFGLDAHVGLDLADEGFLWHGVRETARGAVPLRDFQAAYEPGRYYWGAAFAPWLGDGLLALRASTAAFGALGVWLGLLAARRISLHPLFAVACAALFAVWMTPRHKPFESGLALASVWVGVRLLERPSPGRHAAAGVAIGVAACFGRNLALYAGVGLTLVALFAELTLRPPQRGRRLAAAVGGGLAGASPLIGMMLLVPGFATAEIENAFFYLERGVNHPLPTPWPWTLDPAALGRVDGLAIWSVGSLYLLMAVAYPLGLLLAVRTRGQPVSERGLLVVASAIGIGFAHHASVRSDASHLAQCIHPLLLLVLAAPRALGVRPLGPTALVWLGVLTAFALPEVRPPLARLVPWVVPLDLARLRVGADRLLVGAGEAAEIRQLESVVRERVPDDEELFVAPTWPGLYPLLGRSSPVWPVYFLWPGSEGEQQTLVAQLEGQRVRWALIQLGAPFGIEALRFQHSHPAVWAYLAREFQPVDAPRAPRGHLLLERRGPGAR